MIKNHPKFLRPMVSLYGSKWRLATRYPIPQYDTIIEPFCGSAGYSLRYYWKHVILNDLNPVVAGIWDYLIHVSEAEILQLPAVVYHIDDYPSLCSEARNLIAFWLNKGCGYPRKSATRWTYEESAKGFFWSEKCKQRIASQLQYIRHWKIYQGEYDNDDVSYYKSCTYFIDPPYQYDRHGAYPYDYKYINYEELGEWCQSLRGQVIVCENEGADWLPFEFLHKQNNVHHSKNKVNVEVCYYQEDYNEKK